MGTLFDQSPRRWHNTFDYSNKPPFDELMEELLERTKKYKISLQQAIDVARLSEEIRKTNVMIDNHDAKDEQLADFGVFARDLVYFIGRIVEEYEK